MYADIGNMSTLFDYMLADIPGRLQTNRFNGTIDPSTIRQLQHTLYGIFFRGVNAMRRSHCFGELESVVIDIDHDDIGRRIELSGQQAAHADRAGTDNR